MGFNQTFSKAAEWRLAVLALTNWDGRMAMFAIGGTLAAIIKETARVFYEPSCLVV